MLKRQKHKEYYIDNRTSTAKKGKKKRNSTQTPISNSVSFNHHKYQKESNLHPQQNEHSHKKMPLSNKQMKMMMRCFQEYCCSQGTNCSEVAQKYKVTSKIFDCLQQHYHMVSQDPKINSHFVACFTPIPSMRCEFCDELGQNCDEYQRNTLQKKLEIELQELQMRLLQLTKKKGQLKAMVESKEEYDSAEAQFNELKRIEQLQLHLLKELKAGLHYY